MKNIVLKKNGNYLRMVVIIGLILIISGCGNKNIDSYSTNSVDENEIEDYFGGTDKEENMTDDTLKQEMISDSSQIDILNFLQDGTFWAIEIDELEEQYVIHADINGNIMSKVPCGEFNATIIWGIDNRKLVGEESGYQIFDIETRKDISDQYIGDYDEIDRMIRTEKDVVFSIVKRVDSFEETYECFKLVSGNGDILFEDSLDVKTVLNEYGIEKDERTFSHYIGYCSNNVYYLPYIGDEHAARGTLNSLIVDLNKDKVISVPFPQSNGLYVSSDGDYTLIYSPHHGALVVNNDTNEYMDLNFINIGYYPDDDGELSEHKFLAADAHAGRAILDVQGNIVIDLNNYARSVSSRYAVSSFVDDIAFIRFDDNYLSFIDSEGNILFEPIKGIVKEYYDEYGIAIITDENGENLSLFKKNGEKETIELPGKKIIFYVEYEGKNYLVEGGEGGIHTVEIE